MCIDTPPPSKCIPKYAYKQYDCHTSQNIRVLNIQDLKENVLHDNTLGGVGFMDQLFHKASYLKVATLAYALFWVPQRQEKQINQTTSKSWGSMEGRREGLKNSQPRSLRRHMQDNTQYISQTLVFISYETVTSEKKAERSNSQI